MCIVFVRSCANPAGFVFLFFFFYLPHSHFAFVCLALSMTPVSSCDSRVTRLTSNIDARFLLPLDNRDILCYSTNHPSIVDVVVVFPFAMGPSAVPLPKASRHAERYKFRLCSCDNHISWLGWVGGREATLKHLHPMSLLAEPQITTVRRMPSRRPGDKPTTEARRAAPEGNTRRNSGTTQEL